MGSCPCSLPPVVIKLIKGESVLDVACGYGLWGHLISTNSWEAGLTKSPSVDGLDAFTPNVEICARSGWYRRTWQQILPSDLNGSWDTVLAIEFLEHLEQKNVNEVVDLLESRAKERIIFSTPNYPFSREGLTTPSGFNQYEAHRSYISRRFFKQRGYKLIGVDLGNPSSIIARVLDRLPGRSLLGSIPRLIPSLGIQLVAFKDTK
ncbi:MAG: methyltransferase domain-containing protein [Candidatus Omnitrophica bacterium]|nr:methyltransferase domain-containing protein [Candidatus Omnitrophota bacterium]